MFLRMHIVQEEIGIPRIQEEKISDVFSVFTFAPLPPGFGHTLGNALRRTLLSAVPGSAITKVKIKGVSHEYSTLEGLHETVLNVILNLKQVAFSKKTVESEVVSLQKKGEGDVLASDFIFSSDTVVLNPDTYITALDKVNSSVDLEMVVEKGIGFSSAKERQKKGGEAGWILVDSIFSPVVSVRYEVLPARVGEWTNLDTLKLEVKTNGGISPQESLRFASQILEGYFVYLQNGAEEKIEEEFMADFSSKPVESHVVTGDEEPETYTPIEILNLSPRTLNALINGNIGSVEEVLSSAPSHLESMRGFGKKAMTELADALKEHGYDFNIDE